MFDTNVLICLKGCPMNKNLKNSLIIVVIIVAALALIALIRDKIRVSQTVSDMALDPTNTIITGIWDSENLSKYKYLVIPGEVVGSGNMLEFAKVTDIGEGAFKDNIWIESVHIPTNIVRIQKEAFSGCSALEKVTYAGTKEQWEKIVIESGNECLKNVSVEYNADAPYTADR